MLKKGIVSLFGLILLGLMPPAFAAELKLGFVNTQRIQRESAPAQRIQKKLEKEFAARDAELQKMAQQGRDLQTYLEKEGVVASDADRREKERQLAALNRDFQRMQREFREDLNLRQNEEYVGLLDRVNKVIQQIAEQEKYDMILQDAVYVSKQIDITDRVLKALVDKEPPTTK
jgi:outer membrane protein